MYDISIIMARGSKIMSIIIIALLLGILVLVKSAYGQKLIQKMPKTPEFITQSIQDVPKKEPETKPVRMVFVGDIMMTRGVEISVNKNYTGDFSKLFENVSNIRDADIAFANLEGAVSDTGNNVGSKYSFRMNPKILPVLKNTGFDIVSFANNHVGDWNVAGFTDTLKRLRENNILFTGAGDNKTDARQVKIIEKNGMKIGFLGFSDVGPNWIAATETNPGILIASDPNRTQIITAAKATVDFLVVSYHWGDEYKPFNTRQKTLAESSIDAGADLIIGHHPHVIQDYAKYKGKLIFYSLGNFMFDQSFSPETMRGLIVDITINHDGTYGNIDLKVSEQDKTHRIVEVREFDRENDAALSTDKNNTICPKPNDPNQSNLQYLPVSHDLGLGSYIPDNLQLIPKTISTNGASFRCLTENTLSALEKMEADGEKEGISLVVTSAYRSPSIQQTLFSVDSKPETGTFPIVAKPEHSEHQLGTAVDFKSGTDSSMSLQAFMQSPEYAWLDNNAYKYGFVQSYRPGTESITGYSAEPWHWRYVGIENATTIRSSGLTPYEYLKSLQ
jgi:poly-gamma-glutamate synthesis protein (capsule biosynthesis protein)